MRSFSENLKELSSEKRWTGLGSRVHRTEHGGVAWVTETSRIQPQDGAAQDASRISDITSRLNLAAGLNEPEDARLTGSTRSLVRRMLGLNISTPRPRKMAPVVVTKSVKRARPFVATERVA